MRRIRLLIAATAATILAAAVTGASVAGNPHSQQPGNSANGKGHQTTPAAKPSHPAHPAKPVKTTKTGKSAKARKSKASTTHASHSSTQVFATPSGKPRHNVPAGAVTGYQQHPGSFGGPGNSGIHKYTVCHNGHAITVDVHSWKAHVEKHGDTLLPYGTKGKQACGAATAPAAPSAPTAPCATTTTAGGVWHHTGSKKNPYVLIHPSTHSAHYSKHEDDKVVTPTSSGATAASCAGTKPATGTSSAGTTHGSGSGPGSGSGGVAGAQTSNRGHTSLASAKTGTRPASASRGGVLGAAAVLGSSVTRGNLPFTGFPLWIAVLAAAALLAGGLLVRRRGRATI